MRLTEATEQVRVAPIRMMRAVFSGIGQLLLAADKFRDEESARADSDDDAQFDPLRDSEVVPAGATTPGGVLTLTEDLPSDHPAPTSQSKKHPRQGRQALDRETTLAPKAKPAKKAQSVAEAKPTKSSKPTKNAKQAKNAKPAKNAKQAKKSKDAKNSNSADVAAGAAEGTGKTRFRSLDSTGNVRVLTSADIVELAQPEAIPTAAATAIAQGANAAAPRTSAAPPTPAEPGITPAEPVSDAGAAMLPVTCYDDRSLPSLRSRLRYLDAAQLRVLVSYEKSHAQREDVVSMFQRRIAKLEAADTDAS